MPLSQPVRPLVSTDMNNCIAGDQEFDALCVIEEGTLHTDAEKLANSLKRFAGFESFPSYSSAQLAPDSNNRLLKFSVGLPSEASAPLNRGHKLSSAIKVSEDENANNRPAMRITQTTQPIDIVYNAKGHKEKLVRAKLCKEKCWSSETQREEAWERRKDRHLATHLSENSSSKYQSGRTIQRSISDCIGIGGPPSYTFIPRTRSLTDEDLEELRGCIDLGFGFSNEADPELWDTLPALELCYAVSQQLENEQSRLSSTLAFDNNSLNASSSLGSSSASSSASSWLVCSPGDHPQEVKERLRHWAQAVAFTVRQSSMLPSTVPCSDVKAN